MEALTRLVADYVSEDRVRPHCGKRAGRTLEQGKGGVKDDSLF